jgi:hypothetical protein
MYDVASRIFGVIKIISRIKVTTILTVSVTYFIAISILGNHR